MSAFLKYFLGLTFILYSFSLSAQLKSTVGKKSGDLGNNTFGNPILSGDYPDPSIMRDGKDYYMTHSAFDWSSPIDLNVAWIDPCHIADETGQRWLFLKIRNMNQIITGFYSYDGINWEQEPWSRDISGYHHNVLYDFISILPGLFAYGKGTVRYSEFQFKQFLRDF
jgi:beta-xylosidase